MVPYLVESTHRHIGYVDPRTVLRPECRYASAITTIELTRLGFRYQIPIGWNHFLHADEIVDALSQFGTNCSGERWTAVNLSSTFTRKIVFAFYNANDAMLMRLLSRS